MMEANSALPDSNVSDLDERWQKKQLAPHQLMTFDVRLEKLRQIGPPRLEVRERVTADLVPPEAALPQSMKFIRASEASRNPIEHTRLYNLEEEYGWMSNLRLREAHNYPNDPKSAERCRWIHISSKFPEYLRGCLWALSGEVEPRAAALAMQELDQCIQKQERFSRHGKYFAPFFQHLKRDSSNINDAYPMLISIPFLDWTVSGATPPLRFQVDKREGYVSTRTSSHLLRSVLQHFYRLEDTSDREKDQVFNKHKPWVTDRELDLKVRSKYGQHPTGLNVDEMWILVIDPQHIVTFASNQSWKSRWPPLQLAARIEQVSFRGIRNELLLKDEPAMYSTLTHSIACLSGAVGILHRSFWSDTVLCLTDRYAGYLGHLVSQSILSNM